MRVRTFDKTQTVSRVLWVVVGVLLLSQVQTVEAQTAEVQTTVGGHVGFVLPLVTHAGGQTTNIVDNFSIGFPLGVTFRRAGSHGLRSRTGSCGTRDAPADHSHGASGVGVGGGAQLRRWNTSGV